MPALGLVGLALAGCRFSTVEPTPFVGRMPTAIAVWPGVHADYAAFSPSLSSGLDAALAGRGYHMVSMAVGRQLLGDAGLWRDDLAQPADLAVAGDVLAVDAILVFEVRDYEDRSDDGGRRLLQARWDLGWRLLSTRGDGVLWQHSHHGNWRRRDEDGFDPLHRLDAPPATVPLGGDGSWRFRDREDLMANLHLLAMQHLPRR
ncbi:MAG: hypothetical protein KDC98_10615 [Planctomycetes bacterium]|nr:hypothetical protein [Planctomycetota bacterium]